jgi:hypothetical protein
MALIINPTEEGNSGGGGERRPKVRAGSKVLWAAGTKWGESKAGNVKIDVRFLCVEDPDGGKDVGGFIWDTFTLTERAAWKLSQFARAANVGEPWDAEDETATDNVLMSSPIMVQCEDEAGLDGAMRVRCQRYSTWGGEITDEMEAMLAKAEDFHMQGQIKAGNTSDIPF